MKTYLYIICAAFILGSCAKLDRKRNVPDCIEVKINKFKSEAQCDKDANVKEYKFQGNLVYVFDNGTCGADMASEVLDESCKRLGHLGGISGETKINGEEFSNANFKRTLWEK
jgi:hypothetical protein